MVLFAQTTGYATRLAKIYNRLQGGLICQSTAAESVLLPTGALHATYTVIGGYLTGINYTTIESLPSLSQLLSIQFPHVQNCRPAFEEEMEHFRDSFSTALKDSPERLVPIILKRWSMFICWDQMKHDETWKEEIQRWTLVLERVAQKTDNMPCYCGFHGPISKHFWDSHVLLERNPVKRTRRH